MTVFFEASCRFFWYYLDMTLTTRTPKNEVMTEQDIILEQ